MASGYHPVSSVTERSKRCQSVCICVCVCVRVKSTALTSHCHGLTRVAGWPLWLPLPSSRCMVVWRWWVAMATTTVVVVGEHPVSEPVTRITRHSQPQPPACLPDKMKSIPAAAAATAAAAVSQQVKPSWPPRARAAAQLWQAVCPCV